MRPDAAVGVAALVAGPRTKKAPKRNADARVPFRRWADDCRRSLIVDVLQLQALRGKDIEYRAVDVDMFDDMPAVDQRWPMHDSLRAVVAAAATARVARDIRQPQFSDLGAEEAAELPGSRLSTVTRKAACASSFDARVFLVAADELDIDTVELFLAAEVVKDGSR